VPQILELGPCTSMAGLERERAQLPRAARRSVQVREGQLQQQLPNRYRLAGWEGEAGTRTTPLGRLLREKSVSTAVGAGSGEVQRWASFSACDPDVLVAPLPPLPPLEQEAT
jgi:hypothetical protein